MEPVETTARLVESVDLAGAVNGSRLVSVVVELTIADLLTIDRLRDSEQRREGTRPSRTEVIRRAIQFCYEKHQEVII